MDSAEKNRLHQDSCNEEAWKQWGPYLAERQWGSVREDYSLDGNAWDYFTHDQAYSRAYRWGEDGIAGISDDKQYLCFALACWNERDPIIKERLFGLTNSEGNHGEDIKECYFYLDNTPTHSYMKYLYKYPQGAYPYDDLVSTNKQRTKEQPEYELNDTGIFDDNRYFDIVLEYAKETPEDICIKISVTNRANELARLHLLPTLWFRNIWSWFPNEAKPSLEQIDASSKMHVVKAAHSIIGTRYLYCFENSEVLFTENETNNERIFQQPNASLYVKDGVQNALLHGRKEAVNPDKRGTKAVVHYVIEVEPGMTKAVYLRLTPLSLDTFNEEKQTNINIVDQIVKQRKEEADEFYNSVIPSTLTNDEKNVMHQALAGMLWSKQYYYFDADTWLAERGSKSSSHSNTTRNTEWFHMYNDDIISMPDKWEYPWYAAWDLAFHSLTFSLIDLEFAKQQLNLILSERYLHPCGQIPAYEWNFSDVNPPVHALAALAIYNYEKMTTGKEDFFFLQRIFGKLMLNFTWWVNRKDRFGKNVFEGGFLGLDNIGVFDRSRPLPMGGYLEQADGTAWMILFCINMLEIAAELAVHDPVYDDLAIKFVDHFLYIASAMNHVGHQEVSLWDEEDGFYYDILRLPDGTAHHLKVRSIVGLLPLCGVSNIDSKDIDAVPHIVDHFFDRILRKPSLASTIHPIISETESGAGRWLFAVVNKEKLCRILTRMLDENEFLSPYGIRAMSRHHLKHPYKFFIEGKEYSVSYVPNESNSGMFGGNSNWRGPVWFPINSLLIRALLQYYLYYGDSLKVECPTGSGNYMNLFDIGKELAQRLSKIFLLNKEGYRPFANADKFKKDPNWRDHILFHEYFHGDNGAGLGATHQTGWTGQIAYYLKFFGDIDAKEYLLRGHETEWIKS